MQSRDFKVVVDPAGASTAAGAVLAEAEAGPLPQEIDPQRTAVVAA